MYWYYRRTIASAPPRAGERGQLPPAAPAGAEPPHGAGAEAPSPAPCGGSRAEKKPKETPNQGHEGGAPRDAKTTTRQGRGGLDQPEQPPGRPGGKARWAGRAADRGPAQRAAQEGPPDDDARQGRRRRGDRPAYRRSPARRARRAEHGASGRRSGAGGGDGEGRTTPAPDAPARTAGERKPPQNRRKSNIFRFGNSERQILHREFDIMLEIWSDFCYYFLIT